MSTELSLTPVVVFVDTTGIGEVPWTSTGADCTRLLFFIKPLAASLATKRLGGRELVDAGTADGPKDGACPCRAGIPAGEAARLAVIALARRRLGADEVISIEQWAHVI